MDILKEKIIFNVIEFLDTGDLQKSQLSKQHLQDFAKKHHVKIKLQRITNTKQALKDFILNNNGYNETIPKLYNSL